MTQHHVVLSDRTGGFVCSRCKARWDADDTPPNTCVEAPSYSTPIKVTADDHVYSPEPGVLVTSVHYETDPKTGKRRVIIGFG